MIDYIIEVCMNLWGPPIIEMVGPWTIRLVELVGPWVELCGPWTP